MIEIAQYQEFTWQKQRLHLADFADLAATDQIHSQHLSWVWQHDSAAP